MLSKDIVTHAQLATAPLLTRYISVAAYDRWVYGRLYQLVS